MASSAGASLTYPIRAGEVKKGSYVLLKNHPCKVIEVTTSKTGKHGHAKANITGTDIFAGTKHMDISPTSHNMEAPFVSTKTWTLDDVKSDGFVTLSDEEGNVREDLKLPKDEKLAKEITDAHEERQDGEWADIEVQVTSAMGIDQVMSVNISK